MNRRLRFKGLVAILLVGASVFAGETTYGSPISLNWVHSTIRVENEWGKGGTGFLVIRKMDQKQGKLFLVTNKHVVHVDPQTREKAVFLTLFLNVREKDGAIVGKSFQVPLVEDGHKLWREHPNRYVDVLAVDVTFLVNSQSRIENIGVDYSLFATPGVLKEENITEGDEVLILGYPLGLFHTRIHSPWCARGSWPRESGKRFASAFARPPERSEVWRFRDSWWMPRLFPDPAEAR